MKKEHLTLIKNFKAFQLAVGQNQHFQRNKNHVDNLDVSKNPFQTSKKLILRRNKGKGEGRRNMVEKTGT
ncbi:MAG: hypothetical protein IKY94_05520 [Lachnospiraceae bacterium]|nr:hypothetical protein [Lachnospiraceae bacterium]